METDTATEAPGCGALGTGNESPRQAPFSLFHPQWQSESKVNQTSIPLPDSALVAW